MAIQPQRPTLPIIDISPWINHETSTDEARNAVATALHAACIDYGFFYLNISSYVDSSETDELTVLGRKFFALPQEEKNRLALSNEDHARGYAKLQENVTNGKADNHEGIDFYAPVENPDKTKPLWGENQWPDVQDFRAKYEVWIEKMKHLGTIVMQAMAQGLGMTASEWEDLKSKVDNSFWVMRVIGYPQLPTDHDGFSCGAHKDYGCLTLLHADPTPHALQVFLPESKSIIANDPSISDLVVEKSESGLWINADPIPGCIVCNIGEMWEIWTNGLYQSTLHRVSHRGTNFRVSIPFFLEPNFDAEIIPLPAALRLQSKKSGSEESEQYKPLVYGDFLMKKVGNNFATNKYDN